MWNDSKSVLVGQQACETTRGPALRQRVGATALEVHARRGSEQAMVAEPIVSLRRTHCLSGGSEMQSAIVKRSIVIAGHKTSVSLEDEFWNGLKEIARDQRATLSNLVGEVDTRRSHGNLSSTIRLFVLDHYRARMAALASGAAVDGTLQPSRSSANLYSPLRAGNGL